ncbi:unnamed protein product, partial [Prorocentrum cordatum]
MEGASGAAAASRARGMAPLGLQLPGLGGRGRCDRTLLVQAVDQDRDVYEQCRKLVSHDGYVYDNALGTDASNHVYTAARAGLLHIAGLQPSSDPGSTKEQRDEVLCGSLKDSAGNPVQRAWANATLVLMLLLIREPRPTLPPYGSLGHIGDILEATLCICPPYNNARLSVRDSFGRVRNLGDVDFRRLVGRLETFIKACSRLVTVAHRRPDVGGAHPSATWKEASADDFPLVPALQALGILATPAGLSSLQAEPGFVVCTGCRFRWNFRRNAKCWLRGIGLELAPSKPSPRVGVWADDGGGGSQPALRGGGSGGPPKNGAKGGKGGKGRGGASRGGGGGAASRGGGGGAGGRGGGAFPKAPWSAPPESELEALLACGDPAIAARLQEAVRDARGCVAPAVAPAPKPLEQRLQSATAKRIHLQRQLDEAADALVAAEDHLALCRGWRDEAAVNLAEAKEEENALLRQRAQAAGVVGAQPDGARQLTFNFDAESFENFAELEEEAQATLRRLCDEGLQIMQGAQATFERNCQEHQQRIKRQIEEEVAKKRKRTEEGPAAAVAAGTPVRGAAAPPQPAGQVAPSGGMHAYLAANVEADAGEGLPFTGPLLRQGRRSDDARHGSKFKRGDLMEVELFGNRLVGQLAKAGAVMRAIADEEARLLQGCQARTRLAARFAAEFEVQDTESGLRDLTPYIAAELDGEADPLFAAAAEPAPGTGGFSPPKSQSQGRGQFGKKHDVEVRAAGIAELDALVRQAPRDAEHVALYGDGNVKEIDAELCGGYAEAQASAADGGPHLATAAALAAVAAAGASCSRPSPMRRRPASAESPADALRRVAQRRAQVQPRRREARQGRGAEGQALVATPVPAQRLPAAAQPPPPAAGAGSQAAAPPSAAATRRLAAAAPWEEAAEPRRPRPGLEGARGAHGFADAAAARERGRAATAAAARAGRAGELGLGPLRIQPRGPADAAEGSLCLRSRGLAACVQEAPRPAAGGGEGSWHSPAILVPLAHMAGGACAPAEPGAPAAHVALVVGVDWDPEEILAAAGVRQFMEEAAGNARVNSESVEQRLREAERRLEDNVAAAKRSVYHAASLGLEEAERAKRSLRAALADARSRSESLRQCFKEQGAPSPPRSAAGRAAPDGRGEAGQAEPRTAQAWSARGVEELLCAPDLAAEGWVCLQGPHGQQCWHHRS